MKISECRLCPRRCGASRSENVDLTAENLNVRESAEAQGSGGEGGKAPGERGYLRGTEKRKHGFCGESGVMRISRAALHMWEEPVISGTRGSGAVFFTGCNLRCIFCQNAAISEGGSGKEVTPGELADVFFSLKDQGAHNINLVTPTHFIPGIRDAIQIAKKRGFDLPFVYNTSGYESAESLRMLEGLIDVYLPDFKYMDAGKAAAYSNAPDYPGIAKAAIAEMFRQVGEPVIMKENPAVEANRSGGMSKELSAVEEIRTTGEDSSDIRTTGEDSSDIRTTEEDSSDIRTTGEDSSDIRTTGEKSSDIRGTELIKKGVIVRHLVLPLGVKNACAVIDYLAEEYGDSIYISIMNQYTPLYDVPNALREEQRKRLEPYKELHRGVTKREYDRVIEHCFTLGLTNVFIQEKDASGTNYIPAWNEGT